MPISGELTNLIGVSVTALTIDSNRHYRYHQKRDAAAVHPNLIVSIDNGDLIPALHLAE